MRLLIFIREDQNPARTTEAFRARITTDEILMHRLLSLIFDFTVRPMYCCPTTSCIGPYRMSFGSLPLSWKSRCPGSLFIDDFGKLTPCFGPTSCARCCGQRFCSRLEM